MTTPIKSAQVLNLNYLARAERDPAALRRDFDDMVLYMKGSTAIHHGEYVRTCFSPKLLPAADFDRLAADMQILYRIFEKVIDAYFADAGYRALFGFDTRTEDLILHARRITTLHEGLRWGDIKRYGITVYRRTVDNRIITVTDTMLPDDPRRAVQLPNDVIQAGLPANPRNN